MYYMKKKNNNNSLNLFDEMSNMFSDTFGGRNKFMKTDIVMHDDSYLFTVDLPGVSKKDINISLEDGYLVVKYEHNTESEANKKYVQRERIHESATRSFYVGDVKETDIKAKLDNGVLTINVPKETKPVDNKKCISIE